MLDLFGFLERFGASFAVSITSLICLLLVIYKYIVKPKYESLMKEQEEALAILRKIKTTYLGESGMDLKTLIEGQTLNKTLIKDLRNLVDTRCGTMSCPAVKMVDERCKDMLLHLDERMIRAEGIVRDSEDHSKEFRDEKWRIIEKSFNEFKEEARTSREETQRLIKQIFDRVYEFTEKTGLALIDAIRKKVEENGGHHSKKGSTSNVP